MSFQPGDILLDKYRIDRFIGAGAFAEVYQATHLKLHAVYALKVLRRDESGMGSSEYGRWVERFRQEARLGAGLKSAHIVPVYDYEEENDLLVLRMDYLPGGSLADRLQKLKDHQRQMPVDEAVRIAVEVAQGLAVMHDKDVVHRDVKPNNILFAADGRALVADLGLAQTPGGSSDRHLLSWYEVMSQPGTVEYKSPEQRNNVDHLTSASDVHTLGAVLFEMLTGRLLRNVKPGTTVQSLRADTPDWLAEVMGRMLAKVPEDRLWDGSEAAEALRNGAGEAQRREVEKRREAEEAAARKAVEEKAQREAAEAARKKAEEEEQQRKEAAARKTADEKARREAARRKAEEEEQQRKEAAARKTAEEKARREAEEAKWRAEEAKKQLPVWQQIGIELVTIPAGEFLMGSDPNRDKDAFSDEQPQHRVKLAAYQLAKTPVTNRQYKAFADATAREAPQHWQGGRIPASKEGHPVVNVSWHDAVAFCQWAGLRLPSEAEWEKGARGTDGRLYSWGYEAPDDLRCNFNNKVRDTTEVRKYPRGASPYGLVDMAGNAWEWTSSLFKGYPYQVDDGREDQTADASRVLRGGSWGSVSRNVRSAFRNWGFPDLRNDDLGFRCARSL